MDLPSIEMLDMLETNLSPSALPPLTFNYAFLGPKH